MVVRFTVVHKIANKLRFGCMMASRTPRHLVLQRSRKNIYETLVLNTYLYIPTVLEDYNMVVE
jgi:hypothetical protein